MAMLKPKMKLKDISNHKSSEMKSASNALGALRKSAIEMPKAIKAKKSKGYK